MTKYKRDTEFSRIGDIGAIGQKLDSELDVIGNKLEAVLDIVRNVVNDDGSLKAVVNAKSLTGEVSLGIGEASEWQPEHVYIPNQMVFFQYGIYWCKIKHKSDLRFATDAEYWNVIIDFAPYIEKVAKLANSAHVVRVSENMGLLIALAEQTSKLLELSQHIDKLLELTRRLPDLDKLINKEGNVVLQDIYTSLPAIHAVNKASEDVVNVSQVHTAIAELAVIAPELKKLADTLSEVRVAAKAISSLKIIAGEMEKIGVN